MILDKAPSEGSGSSLAGVKKCSAGVYTSAYLISILLESLILIKSPYYYTSLCMTFPIIPHDLGLSNNDLYSLAFTHLFLLPKREYFARAPKTAYFPKATCMNLALFMWLTTISEVGIDPQHNVQKIILGVSLPLSPIG